ncbi:hypothetical protein AB0K00_34345 [Dactylosporangium sp. NPDC049525]|uniref:hypothetical protein n=1 Tax=Dactylosporangium sp. NPDC049525 TaxID=3154730 RepID=UPI0034256EFA
MSETVEPFSNGIQIGLRVPVILFALAGVVLALVLIRRLGALAGILGALGGLFVAADQVVNVAWVLQLTSMANGDFDPDEYTTVNNAYTVADPIVITIGVALLVGALAAAALRKRADPRPAPYQQAPFPQQPPPFPQQQFPQQPPQQFPPQPQPPFNAQ